MENKTILSVKEVAELLGLNYFTITRYAKTGRLPAFKSGRKWLFHRETLDAFIREKTLSNIAESTINKGETGN